MPVEGNALAARSLLRETGGPPRLRLLCPVCCGSKSHTDRARERGISVKKLLPPLSFPFADAHMPSRLLQHLRDATFGG